MRTVNLPQTDLMEQLAEVERQVTILMSIRGALQAAIATLSNGEELHFPEQQSLAAINRIAIERRIIARLMAAGLAGVPTTELFLAARQAAPGLKYSTFRSHLHRLKVREKIRRDELSHGVWLIAQRSS